MATLLVTAAGAIAGACAGDEPLALCGTIPAGGCPIGRGGTCDDPTCGAVYDCVDSTWRVTKQCTGNPGADAGASTDAGAPDAPCGAIAIDHTGEASSCAPQLEEPDCPAVAAEQCAATACLTGCVDFFLCTKDGWKTVAYCDDDGSLVASAR